MMPTISPELNCPSPSCLCLGSNNRAVRLAAAAALLPVAVAGALIVVSLDILLETALKHEDDQDDQNHHFAFSVLTTAGSSMNEVRLKYFPERT